MIIRPCRFFGNMEMWVKMFSRGQHCGIVGKASTSGASIPHGLIQLNTHNHVKCFSLFQRRFPFIREDYNGYRYPLNPSLNVPFGLWNNNLPPPTSSAGYPPVKTVPNYPGHAGSDSEAPSYSWILSASGKPYAYQVPGYPSARGYTAQANAPGAAPLGHPVAVPAAPAAHLMR
uniref:Uncharacterized protein n=1 Tax=Oryctolagus cuniculus TaxID=9986 RepID=A0A5F9CPB7_RABIT